MIKMDCHKYVANSLADHIQIMKLVKMCDISKIEKVADVIAASYNRGGKLLIFGNGGSAADAQHFAAELEGWYGMKNRGGLPAMALACNSSTMTAVANDSEYDVVFSRQVSTHGNLGDVAFGITTSGNSPNIVRGLLVAQSRGLETVALTGEKDGEIARFADYQIKVPSSDTPRIQEAHIAIIHILCGLIEYGVFTEKQERRPIRR